jgi:hypothetical protein
MSLPIISIDQRLAEKRGSKLVIFGPSGIGKTTLLNTLGADKTLFVDLEAGDLAVQDWPGDTIRPQTWQEFRDFAVFLGGPNPALRDEQPFSSAHYQFVCERFGDPATLSKYDTYFIDSITVLARLCFQWCKGQPQAFSEKTGKPDSRGAYGLLGQELIAALTHLQHTRDKNVVLVGILDEKIDDFNRKVFVPQIEGSKTSLELPGIVDQVITMTALKADDGSLYRAFVCHTLNPWGYPAKDRSGRLDQIEEPHLGRLMAKIAGPVRPAAERLHFNALPSPQPNPTQSTEPNPGA